MTVPRWAAPRARTLAALLDECAERQPEALAVVSRGRHVRYGDWATDAVALARVLARHFGLRRGDRVALLCTNRLEWLAVAFAAARLGAPLVGISTWSRSVELEYVLQHARPTLVVTLDRFRSGSYLRVWRELLPELWDAPAPESFRSDRFPFLRGVVILESDSGSAESPRSAPEGELLPRGAYRYADLVRMGAAHGTGHLPPGTWASSADVAFVLYTSGSTARPKAVPLQHYACIENGYHIGERQGLRPTDRVWLSVPLFWSYGSANALMALMTHGAAAVLQEAFEAGEALTLIEQEQCTVYYGLPNITRALVDHPAFRPERTGSLRTGLTIGSAADIRLTAEELGVHGICNIYGSTETYGNCAVTPTTDSLELRAESQGPPLPGVTVRVVDPATGVDVACGETGEFWVKGYVMPGYLDDPEQTATSLTVDGFFRTGDLGRIDDAGYVRFLGRATEMIKTGGINVSPLEVEEFLATCPGVGQACVVGVPHPVKGEIVAALVRRTPGSTLSAAELRAHCWARIAAYKVPEVVMFVDDLPRTETGKPHRRKAGELAAKEWSHHHAE